MATLVIPNNGLVDRKSIEDLLNLFQLCESKDKDYLAEKGQLEITDIYLVLMNALKSDDNSLLPDAVIATGQFLHNVSWVGSLTENQCGDIILELCHIIETTKEKSICSRALWCFYIQELCSNILSKHVKTILLAFSKTFDGERFASSSVEFEATRATKTLLSTNPQDVLLLSEIWWNDCFARTIHPASRVRDMALRIITEHRHLLGQNSYVMQTIPDEVKSTIVPGMVRLFSENAEIYVLKLWQSVVNLCGMMIHQGSSLINSLLAVVEKAFKHSSEDIRIASFACWHVLISNFSLAPDVIGNLKRLRLILQPLCSKNAKTERSIRAKIDTWWHLLTCLGLNINSFEMVFEPLIQFCFGLGDLVGSSGFGGSHKPRSSIDASVTTSCDTGNELFAANKFLLVEFGIEILGRFFEACSSLTLKLPCALKLGPLHHNMLLKSAVLINSSVLLQAIEVATCTPLPEKDIWSLVSYIWHNVTHHLKSLLDTPDNKPNKHDAISKFYQTVEAVSRYDDVDSRTVLVILDYAASLPASVLMSSSYNLGKNNKLNDTPGFQLLGILLSKNLVEKFGYRNKFTALFNRLTMFSSLSPVSILNSFHSSIQIISKAVPNFQKEDLVCKLWSSLVDRLMKFVEETQEVNQGDSLEHDFSCMHVFLVFPFQHFVWKLAVKRNVLKKWEALYQVFARCAAVVSGVDANVCCIELASKLKAVIPESLQIEEVDDLNHVINALLNSVHWAVPKTNSAAVKESKWMKKKAADKFELAPIIQFIGGVISSFNGVAGNLKSANKSHCVNTALTVIGYFDVIFEKLKDGRITHAVSHLSTPLVEIIHLSSNSDSVFANPDVLNKIENVWEKLMKNLQLNYSGAYDQALLNVLCPLLEATFNHKKRSIQINTRLFWQATFASSYDPHLVPDSLREVIEKVKPIIGMDSANLEDKTIMSSSESKLGNCQNSPGVSSPKVSGSFLNKINSTPSSVKKLFSSPAMKTTPKLKGIEEMNATEFVVIKSPNKVRRRVLTEHQKEVASRRSLIPAMYVDLSQDSCVTPAETHDMEDSQQISNSQTEVTQGISKPRLLDLNKENCAANTQKEKEALIAMTVETSGIGSNSKITDESAAKDTIIPNIDSSSEIAGDIRVNTCVAEGSDEANDELLNSHPCGTSNEFMPEPSSDPIDKVDVLSITCDLGSQNDNQSSLATHAKGDNLDVSNTSGVEETGTLRILNFEEANDCNANVSSSAKSRRLGLRNSKEKVYYRKRTYQKRRASITKDQLSCDFVAETCEFSDTSLDTEGHNIKIQASNVINRSSSDTTSSYDNVSMKFKATDNENSSKNSDDLLREMGIYSGSSISVVCEVLTSEQASWKGQQVVESSIIGGKSFIAKTFPENGIQQQDSVIVISSSSSIETSQSLNISSESCGSQSQPAQSEKRVQTNGQFQRKRKSMRACMGADVEGSPVVKLRKSDKLTEEQVLMNIRSRKRKFSNSLALDTSPPMTRTRKKLKKSLSDTLESVDIAGSSEGSSSFTSSAQMPQDNVITLTVENEAPSSLPGMLDSQANSDIQEELPSLTSPISNDTSEFQQDPSYVSSKSSIDSLSVNDKSVESTAKPAVETLQTDDISIEGIAKQTPSISATVTVAGEPRRSPRKSKSLAFEASSVSSSQNLQDDDAQVGTPPHNCNLPNIDITSSKFDKNVPTCDLPPSEQAIMSGNKALENPAIMNGNEAVENQAIMNGNEALENLSPSCKESCNGTRNVLDRTVCPVVTFSHALKHVFRSPNISPNGIMKKTGTNSKTSTPTPPNKRKVSFADPPVQGESPHTPPSGKRSLRRIVNRRLQMTKGLSQHSMDMTQDSYHSPVITELNCSDCICPDLVGSKESIDILIPHLTSSLHGRGLSKLLSSRNVTTVGDLSSMTEADIHTLPIKSPKLPVVRRALQNISQQTKSTSNGVPPLPSQRNTAVETVSKEAPKTTKSRASSTSIFVTSTPTKNPGADLTMMKESSPMKNLEDEMADDSLCENNSEEALPRDDLQSSLSDKCDSIAAQVVANDNAAAGAAAADAMNESTKDKTFQDIYQFLDTRFDKICASQLSQISGNQIRELIANLGAFSTRVSEAWLDSKFSSDPNHKPA